MTKCNFVRKSPVKILTLERIQLAVSRMLLVIAKTNFRSFVVCTYILLLRIITISNMKYKVTYFLQNQNKILVLHLIDFAFSSFFHLAPNPKANKKFQNTVDGVILFKYDYTTIFINLPIDYEKICKLYNSRG